MKTLPRVAIVVLLVASLAWIAGCKTEKLPDDVAWNNMVASHRHDVEMGGYSMHYIDMGKGPVVLMIHGFADSSYCWHHNVKPVVDAGYRVIAVDMPGLGRSTVPPKDFTMSVDNLSRACLSLMDRLNIETFTVVGSSMGGGVSLFLMGHHPDRAIRGIVVDPASYYQKMPDLISLASLENLGPLMTRASGKMTVRLALTQVYYDDKKVTDTLVAEYGRPFEKEKYPELLSRLVRQYISRQALSDMKEYNRITQPVLVVWGKEDIWVPPAFAKRLENDLSNAELLMVPNAGHLPHQELPDQFNPVLLQFLKKTEAKH